MRRKGKLKKARTACSPKPSRRQQRTRIALRWAAANASTSLTGTSKEACRSWKFS